MMIIERKDLISLPNYGRVYFVKNKMLCRALRKQGSHNTHGTLKDLRKRISVKDDSIVELGVIETSFLKGIVNKSVFWKDEDFCEGDN